MRLASVAISLSLLLYVSTSSAQDAARPLTSALSIDPADAPCLSNGALIARVQGWLRTDEVDADTAIVVRASDADEVSFELHDGDEVVAFRHFDVLPTACDARLAALSLAIALAIDHTVLDRASDPPTPVQPAAPTPPSPEATDTSAPVEAETPAPAEAQPEATTGADWSLGAVLAGGVAIASLPEVAATGHVGLEVGIGPRFTTRLLGALTSEAGADLGGGAVAMQLIGGRLDLCLSEALGPLRLGGCGGLAAGVLDADGKEFATPLSAAPPFVSGVARAFVQMPETSAWALRLAVEALVPILRPRVHSMTADGAVAAQLDLSPVGIQVLIEIFLGAP